MAAEAAKATTKTGVIEPVATMPTAAAAVTPVSAVKPAPAGAVTPAPIVPPVPAAAAVKPAPAAAVKPVPAVTSAAGQARLDEIKGKLLKFIGKFTGQKEKLTESGQEGAAKPELPSAKAATAASKELAKQERQELMDAKRIYEEGLASIKDLISPSSLEVTI